MKTKHVIVLIVALVTVFYGRRLLSEIIGEDTIEYRGEKIRLSKKYFDYDDYKNDPDNIHPSEIGRIQGIMLTTQLPMEFTDRREVIHTIFKLKFPGYGEGGVGGKRLNDGSAIWISSIEIPRSEKERYFTFMEKHTKCYLLDDFTLSGEAGLMDVTLTPDGILKYLQKDTGKLIREIKTIQLNHTAEPISPSRSGSP